MDKQKGAGHHRRVDKVHLEVHPIVLPDFEWRHVSACVLRREEQQLFVDTPQIPAANWELPLVEEDWVLCQPLYRTNGVEEWREMQKALKEVSKKIGMKKAEQKVAGSGEVAYKELKRRSAICESSLKVGNVDIAQALRVCEERSSRAGRIRGVRRTLGYDGRVAEARLQ